MFISIADCHGNWHVKFIDSSIKPKRVCCWGIREISGKHKVVPIVHSKGGKLIDANSLGEIAMIGKPGRRGELEDLEPKPELASELESEPVRTGPVDLLEDDDEVDLSEG